MAEIRKIKASLVKNTDVDTYIGESTYLFYDIISGSLRIYDGTPGGKNLLGGGAGNPAGVDGDIQINDGGIFGTIAGFTIDANTFNAGNYTFNIDETVGAGQDNYILTYDNGTGEISLEVNAPSWGDIIGTVTDQTDLVTYIDTQTEEEMFAQQVDFINDDLLYRGEAAPGSATSAAVWRIRKITIDNSGEGDVVTTWAGGTADFDKIYDDRLGLTYT